LFKWLVNFWAAAAGNDGVLPSPVDLAWTLHCSEKAVESALRELRNRDFLDEIEGSYVPHDWSHWQFESDSSTDRVKRFRERQRNVSSTVTTVSRNVTETPRARATEQSRTETDTDQSASVSSNDEIHDWITGICDRHPNPNNRILSEQALVALCADPRFDRAAFDRAHEAWCRSEKWNTEGGRFVPQLSKWIGDKGYRRMPPAATNKSAGGNLVETSKDDYGWMPPV
jgi:hypothetical protein